MVFPTTASAAPKLVTVKSAVKWAESAEVELFAVTAESVITLKNVLTNTSNIEIQARDFAGTSLWSKTIDSGSDEVATAIAADNQGNIWLAGNSALPVSIETTTAVGGALNPDNVAIENVTPLRQDMRQLTLWKMSKAGEVTETFSSAQSEISIVEAISVVGYDVALHKGARGIIATWLTSSILTIPKAEQIRWAYLGAPTVFTTLPPTNYGTPSKFLSSDGTTTAFNCQERLCAIDISKKTISMVSKEQSATLSDPFIAS